MKTIIIKGVLVLSLLPLSLSFAKAAVLPPTPTLEITVNTFGEGKFIYQYRSNCGECRVTADTTILDIDGHSQHIKEGVVLNVREGVEWNEQPGMGGLASAKWSNFKINSKPISENFSIAVNYRTSSRKSYVVTQTGKKNNAHTKFENEIITWDVNVGVAWVIGGPDVAEELSRMAFKEDIKINIVNNSLIKKGFSKRFHLTVRGPRENVEKFYRELTDFVNGYSNVMAMWSDEK